MMYQIKIAFLVNFLAPLATPFLFGSLPQDIIQRSPRGITLGGHRNSCADENIVLEDSDSLEYTCELEVSDEMDDLALMLLDVSVSEDASNSAKDFTNFSANSGPVPSLSLSAMPRDDLEEEGQALSLRQSIQAEIDRKIAESKSKRVKSPRTMGRKSPRGFGRKSPRSLGRKSPRRIPRNERATTLKKSTKKNCGVPNNIFSKACGGIRTEAALIGQAGLLNRTPEDYLRVFHIPLSDIKRVEQRDKEMVQLLRKYVENEGWYVTKEVIKGKKVWVVYRDNDEFITVKQFRCEYDHAPGSSRPYRVKEKFM